MKSRQARPGKKARCSPITEEDVLAILSARKSRGRFLPDDLFADPAWDLLLQLYAAELGQRRMSVSSLGDGAGVPATTALRWITALENWSLLTRSHDPLDRRRIFLSLSGKGSKAMRSYFAEYGASPLC